MSASNIAPTLVDIQEIKETHEQRPFYLEAMKKLSKETNDYPWTFEVVKGFFKQDDEETNDLEFNYVLSDFGIKKPWKQIIADIHSLNESAEDNVLYKLVFFARHGQGYHNVILERYGLDAWYADGWDTKTHDGDIEYAPDPMLTDLGITQAKENNKAWKEQIAKGAPIPDKFYVSPLQRSSRTLVYTWDGIKEADKHPLVIEHLRETSGITFCDQRSTKTVIKQRFDQHGFEFEEGFTEEDDFFDPVRREVFFEHGIRSNGFLQRLFEADYDKEKAAVDKSLTKKSTFISTTSHAGAIRSFIMVLNHRDFTIPTGGMIPIVIKATRSK